MGFCIIECGVWLVGDVVKLSPVPFLTTFLSSKTSLRLCFLQIVLVAPAFLYAIAVVMWLFEDQDIEFARELAPVSFAALCVHLFAAGEVTQDEAV